MQRDTCQHCGARSQEVCVLPPSLRRLGQPRMVCRACFTQLAGFPPQDWHCFEEG